MKQKLLIILVIVAVFLAAVFVFLNNSGSEILTSFFGGSGSGGGCTDSDGGKNYYKKGILNIRDKSGNYLDDVCVSTVPDRGNLVEYFCEMKSYNQTLFKCPYGCKDGACIPKPKPNPKPSVK